MTGTVIPYYEEQEKLLKQLLTHKHENVRRWAQNKLDETQNRIKIENLNEAHRGL